jgi:hypothetical protein
MKQYKILIIDRTRAFYGHIKSLRIVERIVTDGCPERIRRITTLEGPGKRTEQAGDTICPGKGKQAYRLGNGLQ